MVRLRRAGVPALVSRTADEAEPILLVLLFGAAAATVLVRKPMWQDADGLIGVLFSLQRLTVFF